MKLTKISFRKVIYFMASGFYQRIIFRLKESTKLFQRYITMKGKIRLILFMAYVIYPTAKLNQIIRSPNFTTTTFISASGTCELKERLYFVIFGAKTSDYPATWPT